MITNSGPINWMTSNSRTNQSYGKQPKEQSIGREETQGQINQTSSNSGTNQLDKRNLRINQSDDKQLKD